MVIRQVFLISSVFGSLLMINPVQGQITPDNTANTSVTNNCSSGCDITGGVIAEQNLFHSFEEFKIGQGESTYFVDPGVANIFSRVTGNNLSEILGTLGVSGGDANLFLLNPNGIVFGNGSSLDLNGSFVATTAASIQFGDRGAFAAQPSMTEDIALLTVSPSAFLFNQIGSHNPISLDSGAELNLPAKQNIVLLGAQSQENIPGINFQDSAINTSRGNVTLGAVKEAGKIDLDQDFQLRFPELLTKGDISLFQGSQVNLNGDEVGNLTLQGGNITLTESARIISNNLGNTEAGNINIQADNLTIKDNSSIVSSTVNGGKGSDINISAKESVNIEGREVQAFQNFLANSLSGGDRSNNVGTVIYSFSLGADASGDIKIDAQDMNIQNGAWLLTSALATGKAGNIDISTVDDLTINGSGLITGTLADASGSLGNLTVDSKNILLQNGSVVSSSTLGQGRGGDILLTAADSIKLQTSLPNSVLPTGIYTNTVQDGVKAGDLTINTSQLVIEDGSLLSAASGFFSNSGLLLFPSGGQGGNIIINAAESVKIKGKSPDNRFVSSIANNSFSSGAAGNIAIQTSRFDLEDEALVSASAISTGNGGNITIKADDSVNLKGISSANLQQLFARGLSGDLELANIRGGLLTNTQTGKAGNVRIVAPRLTLDQGGLISATTVGKALGGNIDIRADNVEILGSAIASSTTSEGKAGNINITTDQLTIAENGLMATSSIGSGDAGDVFIDATSSINLLGGESGFLLNNGIFTTSTAGMSYPGNLEINTQDLIISGGAKIDAASGSIFDLGIDDFASLKIPIERFNLDSPKNMTINAESIQISGTSDDGFLSSSITSTTASSFPASNILLNTNQLSIENNGAVSVNSISSGKAGTININAESIYLDDAGNLNANTFSGRGGNINLQVEKILSLSNGSQINTNALNSGDGGNIAIDSTFIIGSETSSITANALAVGSGGDVNIRARELFLDNESEITADSVLGTDGTVKIQTFSQTARNSLARLPEQVIKVDNLIVRSCGVSNEQGVFTYVGRGGLPASLLTELTDSNELIADFELLSSSVTGDKLEVHQRSEPHQLISAPQKIVEAEDWRVNSQGGIELIASTNNNFTAAKFNSSVCANSLARDNKT